MALLSSYGEIVNEVKVLAELRRYIPEFKGFDSSLVRDRVNKSAYRLDKCRYFTNDYAELEENEGGREIMWVDTGFTTRESDSDVGEVVYVQFTGGSPWRGAWVGTEKSILEYQEEYKRNKANKRISTKEKIEQECGVDLDKIDGVTVSSDTPDTKPVQKDDESSTFLNILHSRLLVPNSWTIESLKSYTNLCLSRINSCIAKGKDCSSFIIFNKDESYALINSGLLDNFGKYIMILVKVLDAKMGKPRALSYSSMRVSGGKTYLVGNGFTKEDLVSNIERVPFSDNGLLDLIFTDGIDDFDLDSRERLKHCITERRFRFPEIYTEVSDEVVCADIIRAIEMGVELNKYDRNYIKPIYSKEWDKIHFVIPYHVANDFQKKPELGIVVAKVNSFWQIMTILNYEDVISDIKLFNMYESETF